MKTPQNNQNNNSLPNIDWERVKVDSKYRKEVARRSHKHFFAIYLSHYGELPSAPMHDELFQMTENDDLFSVVQAFRGSGKSTICTLSYPMYAVLGKQGRKFIVICSATEELSQRHLANIKEEFESNERLRHDFGMVHEEESPWNSRALSFGEHGAMIAAISIDQSMRGIRSGSKRPDVFIFDDIEDRQKMKTQEGRDKIFETINSDFIPAGAKEKKLIFVGSSLHADSPMNRLRDAVIDEEIDGSFYHFPIVDANGNPLWKGMYPDKQAIAKKRKEVYGPVAWHNEYLLQATTPADQIVKLDDFHYYDAEELIAKKGLVVIAVDPAIKTDRSNDYTGIVPIFITGSKSERTYYILDRIVKGRFGLMESQSCILGLIDHYSDYDVHVVVEDVGFQSSLIEVLNDKVGDRCVHGFKIAGRNKIERVYEISGKISSSKILFPKKCALAKELIQQVTEIATTKHDDLADALTTGILGAVEHNLRKGSAGIIAFNKDPRQPPVLLSTDSSDEEKERAIKQINGPGFSSDAEMLKARREYRRKFFEQHGRYPY